MTNIIVKANELEAIALFASKDATRYYMNGVCFEIYENNDYAMIATNGHCLGSIATKEKEQPKQSAILSSADVVKILSIYKAVYKATAKASRALLNIRLTFKENNTLTLDIVMNDSSAVGLIQSGFSTTTVEGNFPDWRRVIPDAREAINEISFSGEYMQLFYKACDLITEKKFPQIITTFTHATGPMIITFANSDNFRGLLMPTKI